MTQNSDISPSDHRDVREAVEANAADAEARLRLMERVCSNTYAAGATTSYALTDNEDGTLDWTHVNPELVGKLMEATPADGEAYKHLLRAQYLGIALNVRGNVEKQRFELFLKACDQGVLEEVVTVGETNYSPDSNYYYVAGHLCHQLFQTGNDSSGVAEFCFEAPMDLGKMITLGDGAVVRKPRIMISTGKIYIVKGTVRTHNGHTLCLVDRLNSSVFGTDTVVFDNFCSVDNPYGTSVHVRRCTGALLGNVVVRNSHDGRLHYLDGAAPSIPLPAVRLDRVDRANFRADIVDCENDCGLHIGDAANSLSPASGVSFMNNVIAMNDPTNSCALRIEKATNNFFQFSNMEGNIELGAACQNALIQVPSVWDGPFGVTAHASAVYQVVDFAGNVLAQNA